MNPDSSDQFRQAQALHFNDWHPPILAWLWSITNRVWPGPAGIFLVLTSLYWLGFLLVALYLIGAKSNKYYVALILPFLPFLFNIAGTLCIDLLAFDSFLVAFGLILFSILRRRRGIAISIAVSGLLLVGSLARHNSALAAVPLLTLYLWPQLPEAGRAFHLARRLILAGIIVGVAVVGAGRVLDHYVFRAEKAGIVNALFLWDLVGISHRIGENLVPGEWSEIEAKDIVGRCYEQSEWDNLAIGDCAFVREKLVQSGLWGRGLFHNWFSAVLSHPGAYLSVRLAYARSLMWPRTTFVVKPTEESFQYGFRPSGLYDLVRDVVHFFDVTPGLQLVFTIGFWMIASAVVCIAFFRSLMVRGVRFYPAFLLSLSGSLYVWPLLAGGIAIAFRYSIWSIAATCLSVLLASAARSYPSASATTPETLPNPSLNRSSPVWS